jgi:hypothetical protein
MSDEPTNPKLKIVPPTAEELDEEEKEFRALRRDAGGVRGAADAGILTIRVGKQPTPKNEFFRTHGTFRPILAMVTVVAGLDQHYIAVMPHMIEHLSGIGILTHDHTLYLIITPTGALQIIPAACANADGEQNEWHRTKEIGLIAGIDRWGRIYADTPNRSYKWYEAPKDRFGDPIWPEIKPAKIIRLAFRDKGRLIDSADHLLVQKWAGRDRG